jgi:dihydrofolate synthase/folylpolyglutamate synthase
MTDHEEALQFLFGRLNYERMLSIPYQPRHLKLERMRELLGRLGNPHRALRVIHIAGSKGKGSTASMIASILSAAGYHTGLYTSPHLERVEERISVNGFSASGTDLVQLVRSVQPHVEMLERRGSSEDGPTYFEITTAMAFLYFAEQGVDAAVVEVGLGGRLDSTNVCHPIVTAITSISFDHTKQLGNTLAKIAAEKAGIIKQAVPLVSGVREGAARQVIERAALEHGSPVATLGVDFDFQYQPPEEGHGERAARRAYCGRIDYRKIDAAKIFSRTQLDLGMPGRHQAANAAVAMAVVDELGRQSWDIDDSAVRLGLASASCPARVEVVAREPMVIIDAAHNVASIQALVETIGEIYSGGRRTLVFATTQGKDVRGMLMELLPHFDRIVFTRYLLNPRGHQPDRLRELASQIDRPGGPRRPQIEVCAEPTGAWNTALKGVTRADLLCVSGSFFIAGELRPVILSQLRDRPRVGTLSVK